MTDPIVPWLQFLGENGAQVGADGEVRGYDPAALPAGADALARSTAGFVAPLSDLGLISAQGEDAARFLHSQLTNDVEHLDSSRARRAGYCSPKGRLIATLLMWKTPDAIMLQLPRALQPAIQKRLQMFVLRAKVKLQDMSAQQVALGVGGQAAEAALANWFPQPPASPMEKVDTASGTLIRMPDAFGAPRFMWLAPLEIAKQAWPSLCAALMPSATAVWRLADIQAGIPQILPATQEEFVPQMVNLELVDGVSFKKGCYPGQEIVARSQYLGKLKRRMLPAAIESTDVAPGMEIYSTTDPDQPCGMVVNAASTSAGASEALVEVKLAAVEAGTVHLGSVNGPELRFKPLPYKFPE